VSYWFDPFLTLRKCEKVAWFQRENKLSFGYIVWLLVGVIGVVAPARLLLFSHDSL